MISITTVIHANTKHNKQTQKHRQLRCSGTNVLLTSWLQFVDTRREAILKSLSYHTMLTTSFNGRNPILCPIGRNSTIVFHGPTSKSKLPGRTPTSQYHGRYPTSHHHGRTPTSHYHGRTPTSHYHGRTPTSTVCLNSREPNCLSTWPTVNSQLQILRTIASGHDAFHTPASFPIWGLLWQLWSSYPLRASVNCAQYQCTWTKSRIVQSPTKSNDKI